jgi:hypothetical protein
MLWVLAIPESSRFGMKKRAIPGWGAFYSLNSESESKKTPVIADWGFLGCKSLTMTYFHTGTRTIIGAESFHCPVRDGKEWYQLAMVIRHKGLST